MTYSELEKYRVMTDSDKEQCAQLAAAVEITLSDHPFKGMPRSMNLIGAGLGCMEIVRQNGVFMVFRNNGADIDCILESDADFHDTYSSLIKIIYEGRADEDFSEREYRSIFG